MTTETIAMRHEIPDWAKQRVTGDDHEFSEVQRACAEGRAQIRLPDLKALRKWARSQRWPTPFFGFKEAFLATMFRSDHDFTLALGAAGIEVHVAVDNPTLTQRALERLDALYEARQLSGQGGRPTEWGILVSQLREIRHLVELGVPVRIEETQMVLGSWQDFYSWAHGRYPLLEEGVDSWIGDDES